MMTLIVTDEQKRTIQTLLEDADDTLCIHEDDVDSTAQRLAENVMKLESLLRQLLKGA